MVVSLDVEENSSLISFVEFDERIGLSLELFTLDVDDDDEHFCRLCMCFKS